MMKSDGSFKKRREGRGEHGERGGNRPRDPALRPLYNELLLLRREAKMLADGLRAKRQKKV